MLEGRKKKYRQRIRSKKGKKVGVSRCFMIEVCSKSISNYFGRMIFFLCEMYERGNSTR